MILLFAAVPQPSKCGRTKVIRWRCKFLPIYHSHIRPYPIPFMYGKRGVPIALCGKQQYTHKLLCFRGDHSPYLISALLHCFYLCFSWELGNLGVWHCVLSFNISVQKTVEPLKSYRPVRCRKEPARYNFLREIPVALRCHPLSSEPDLAFSLSASTQKVIRVNHAITWAKGWGTTSESHSS